MVRGVTPLPTAPEEVVVVRVVQVALQLQFTSVEMVALDFLAL
jgi:hypothetical protein